MFFTLSVHRGGGGGGRVPQSLGPGPWGGGGTPLARIGVPPRQDRIGVAPSPHVTKMAVRRGRYASSVQAGGFSCLSE